MLAVFTNEDQTNLNEILLEYLKGITIGSVIGPTNRITYKIGALGKYFVTGLMDDPVNNYLAYLFATDKNVNPGVFGVFKLDFSFTTPKYV